jgi:hypothetical protein
MLRCRPSPLSHGFGRALLLVAVAISPLVLSGCAVLVNGTHQMVPVTSVPERAEVFVDGVSVGFTPIDLRLRRGVDHVVTVRLGERERVVTLTSSVQPLLVAIDVVPIGIAGGLAWAVSFGCALTGFLGGDTSCGGVAALFVAVGAVPLVVDGATGSFYRLGPDAIAVDFGTR